MGTLDLKPIGLLEPRTAGNINKANRKNKESSTRLAKANIYEASIANNRAFSSAGQGQRLQSKHRELKVPSARRPKGRIRKANRTNKEPSARLAKASACKANIAN